MRQEGQRGASTTRKNNLSSVAELPLQKSGTSYSHFPEKGGRDIHATDAHRWLCRNLKAFRSFIFGSGTGLTLARRRGLHCRPGDSEERRRRFKAKKIITRGLCPMRHETNFFISRRE